MQTEHVQQCYPLITDGVYTELNTTDFSFFSYNSLLLGNVVFLTSIYLFDGSRYFTHQDICMKNMKM